MTTPPVPSITDDQIAELERFLGFGGKTLKVNTQPLRGLISRLLDAERDAARYRWLREYENDCFMLNTLQVASMEDLDAAIDAAMKVSQCE